jgi:hypothetical protein
MPDFGFLLTSGPAYLLADDVILQPAVFTSNKTLSTELDNDHFRFTFAISLTGNALTPSITN